MKIDELSVEVSAKIGVPEKTILRCLRLIEWYLNDHPEKHIIGGTRLVDGTIEELRLEDRDDA
jgi:hypothetical protein